jgi:hypothetical protein
MSLLPMMLRSFSKKASGTRELTILPRFPLYRSPESPRGQAVVARAQPKIDSKPDKEKYNPAKGAAGVMTGWLTRLTVVANPAAGVRSAQRKLHHGITLGTYVLKS